MDIFCRILQKYRCYVCNPVKALKKTIRTSLGDYLVRQHEQRGDSVVKKMCSVKRYLF